MKSNTPAIDATLQTSKTDVTTWELPEGAIARLGRSDVNDIAFSSDEKHIAIATDIGIWLYTLPELSPVALWDTQNGHAEVVTFSPDGCLLATYSKNEETLKVWDVRTGICVAHMEDSYQPDNSKPRFSPDSKHLLSGDILWCAKTGALLDETDFWHPDTNYAASNFTFSPDANLVIGERYNNSDDRTQAVVWKVETGEEFAVLSENSEEHTLFWWNPTFSQCGSYLAAHTPEGSISFWELENGRLLNTFRDFGDVKLYPCFAPNGDLNAAVIHSQRLEIWNVDENKIIDTFKINDKYTNRHIVRFSDDGTQLAVSIPNVLTLWTKGENGCHTLTTHNGHTDTADSLAFSADGKTLASAHWDSNVILWDVESQCSKRPGGERVDGTAHAVYLSATGRFIATGGDYEHVLWLSEIGTPKPVAEITGNWLGARQPKAFSPTANRLAIAGDEFSIHLWECTDLQENGTKSVNWRKYNTLIGHTTYIRGLAFSPDGNKLASIAASVGEDCLQDARLWDVNTGEQTAALSIPPFLDIINMYRRWDFGITYSPLGDLIAAGQWGEIVLWNATDGSKVMTIPQPKGSQRPIALSFSPCGRFLASGAWWQPELSLVSIRLWEIASKKNIVTFWSHTTDVQDLQFSPDGTMLASAGHDGVIYLWDLKHYR